MTAGWRTFTMLAAVVFAATLGHAQSRPTDEDAQLYASPAQVRLVQEKLREHGRKPGAAGVWDEATIAEVRDFQKANGLAPTGQLDTSLITALEIGDVLEGERSSRFLDGLLEGGQPADDGPTGRGAPLYVSPVHIAYIQHLLRERGFYEGQIDGVWGAETARAANAFRADQGLEANAAIDVALLRALNDLGTDVPKQPSSAASRTEGAPLVAGPATIRALERELQDRGRHGGAVEGEWGEDTRRALREFQREHELEPTGTLTLPTLAVLDRNAR